MQLGWSVSQMQPSLNDLQTYLNQHLPTIKGLSLNVEPVADHTAWLWPEEHSAIAKAVSKRQYEFSTGRRVARKGMEELGIIPGAVASDGSHRPVWPEACLGSISHTRTFAIAAVAKAGAVRSIGVDLEQGARIGPHMHDKLFTPWELDAYGSADPKWAGLLFSAKESGYKAIHPLVGQYVGFQEVEIDVNWDDFRFSIRYIGDHLSNRILDSGTGYFGFFDDHVISLFVIPC